MFKTIEGTADCEIRSVIRFLNTRNVLPSEIHHQICQVCGDNAMSDGMVSGHPFLVNYDFVRKVNKRLCGNRRFTISDLSLHFPQISRTLLYDIVSSNLGYQKCVHDGCPRYRGAQKKTVLHVL